VLVSEFMLQQTPVARVLPVYATWLARWPSPADLAVEPAGEAVRAWGRLGYPRRALRLHAAAGAIVRDHGGLVPDTVDALLSLPGVGQYTARAVAAFAFRARTPVLDVNVHRVLQRAVRGTDEPGTPTAADRRVLEALLPDEPAVAARFSAALMELGALVCTAARPRCTECPVAAGCRWRRAGSPVAERPKRAQAWAGTDRQVRGRIMAVLRESQGPVPESTLAGLWPDLVQWRRCLDGLLTDGLATPAGRDGSGRPLVALPG
jgi:A/G-specific adenine glycosylase